MEGTLDPRERATSKLSQIYLAMITQASTRRNKPTLKSQVANFVDQPVTLTLSDILRVTLSAHIPLKY